MQIGTRRETSLPKKKLGNKAKAKRNNSACAVVRTLKLHVQIGRQKRPPLPGKLIRGGSATFLSISVATVSQVSCLEARGWSRGRVAFNVYFLGLVTSTSGFGSKCVLEAWWFDRGMTIFALFLWKPWLSVSLHALGTHYAHAQNGAAS